MGQRCSRCGETKTEDDFAWHRKAAGRRDSYCRPCRSAYKKEHYAKNKKRYLRQAKRWKERQIRERMEWIVQYLEEHPCVDCGESDVIVLQFDHVSSTASKLFNIGDAVRHRRWQEVLDEIEKCEIRCANCHRRVTSSRAGSKRWLISISEVRL
ncbi:MAG: hypothetical protein ACLGHL_09030 [Actinomycetota bacterium]